MAGFNRPSHKVVLRAGGEFVKLTREGEKTVQANALVAFIMGGQRQYRDGVYYIFGKREVLLFGKDVFDAAKAAKERLGEQRAELPTRVRGGVRVPTFRTMGQVCAWVLARALGKTTRVWEPKLLCAPVVVEAAPKAKRTRVRKAAQAARAALA